MKLAVPSRLEDVRALAAALRAACVAKGVKPEDADALLGKASAMTPVPGGVGPMTVTMLLVNTFTRWCCACGFDNPLADLLP